MGGDLHGIVGENGGVVHHALFQAYALTVFQVYRGYEQHGAKSNVS
jgi:hypothetical protein